MPLFTDPRQEVLRALRDIPMGKWTQAAYIAELAGYKHAVHNVCRNIEENAQPDELWSSGKQPADLTSADSIGEHLAATRSQFGFIA